jgi:uncharacterized protein YceK
MKRHLITAFLFAGIPFPMSGCGTTANILWFTENEGGQRIYGGIRAETQSFRESIVEPSDPESNNQQSVWPIILDMPFTLIGDTLTLPLTVSISALRANNSTPLTNPCFQSTSAGPIGKGETSTPTSPAETGTK